MEATIGLKEYLDALKKKREILGGETPILYSHDYSGTYYQTVSYKPSLIFVAKHVPRSIGWDDFVEDVASKETHKLKKRVPDNMQVAVIVN